MTSSPLSDDFSRPFAIERSIRQVCAWSPFLYVVALEPLRQRLEATSGDARDPCYSRGATAYADDITVIVSNEKQLPRVKDNIKGYEAMAKAKNNQETINRFTTRYLER